MSPFMGLRVSTKLFGGDERDRTDDPLLAKQVLSQLSYTPIFPYEPQKLNNELLLNLADLEVRYLRISAP